MLRKKELGDYIFTMEDGDPGWSVQVKSKKEKRYGFIPTEVDGIPVVSMRYTFIQCNLMEEAPAIPNGIVDITYAFGCCTRLKSAPEIPQSVRKMRWAFHSCTMLVEPPVIPEGVEDLDSVFYGCRNLKTPPEIPAGVKTMQGTFADCINLSVAPRIPDGVEDISNAFDHCFSLTVPPKVPASVVKADHAFDGCSFHTERTCPKCGRPFSEKPAISRVDGAEICPECGTREALNATTGISEETKEQSFSVVCENEKSGQKVVAIGDYTVSEDHIYGLTEPVVRETEKSYIGKYFQYRKAKVGCVSHLRLHDGIPYVDAIVPIFEGQDEAGAMARAKEIVATYYNNLAEKALKAKS